MTRTPAWHKAITAWSVWLRAADRPSTTVKLRTHQIGRLAESSPRSTPWTVTTAELAQWLANPDWATETRRSHRSAAVMFYRWAAQAGHLEISPAEALPTIKAPKHMARPTPEPVLATAIADADERMHLMLMLGSRQGLRRGEIARVHSDDLVQTLTGWSLLVHGKGGKRRLVPLLPEVAGMLRRRPPGFVFPGQVEGHLSPDTVGVYLARALPGKWTGHTLRHRFATVVFAHTHDLLTLQELLGHSQIETTRLYVQVPDDDLRSAVLHAA